MKKRLLRLLRFLQEDVWRIRARELSRLRSALLVALRVSILALRGLSEDRCHLRASALTFYSLFAVIPVVAMLFGVAKGFGFEKTLEKQLLIQLEGQEEVFTWIITFARNLLEHTQGGVMAGIGVVALFWAIIKALGQIERAFDDIWGILRQRPFGRRVTDYLALILIAPLLFLLSSTTTVLITAQVKGFVAKIALLEMVSPGIFFLLKLLPYGTLWILFGFLYIFIPNTHVRLSSGVLAAVTAGTLYHAFQWTYITFQIGVAKHNAVYGSFAALPLFLVWLHVSWVIVLFGAEISFAHQNVDTYEFEPDALTISQRFRRLLGLYIVHLLVRGFSRAGEHWRDDQIAERLEIPIRLVRQILRELVACGVVSRVKLDEERLEAFQPGCDPDLLTIGYVLQALDQRGTAALQVARSGSLERLSEALSTFDDLVSRSPANLKLADV